MADGNSDIGFARLCFVQWCHEGAHTKVLKLSADYEHTLWNVPNLEKHRSSGMSDAEWLEIPDFAIKIAASGCIWNAIVSFSCHKTYPVKMQSVTVPFPENKKRKRKRFLLRVGLLLLTVAVPRGIEPLFSPWEGDVLTAWPRNRTNAIITGFQKKATPFLKFF